MAAFEIVRFGCRRSSHCCGKVFIPRMPTSRFSFHSFSPRHSLYPPTVILSLQTSSLVTFSLYRGPCHPLSLLPLTWRVSYPPTRTWVTNVANAHYAPLHPSTSNRGSAHTVKDFSETFQWVQSWLWFKHSSALLLHNPAMLARQWWQMDQQLSM